MDPKPHLHLRPSLSTPSLGVVGDRPESFRSTKSRGLRRHGLLKRDSSTDQSIKDLPVPPILTPGPPESMGRNITMRHRISDVSVPTRMSSSPNLVPQHHTYSDRNEGRQPGIVCIDPAIHPPGTHAMVHHPGLVSGADFCDAGFATERDSPIRTPPTRIPPVNPKDHTLTGRTRRRLTGGDICEQVVDVSGHIHGNHSSAVKVRPAAVLFHRNESHTGHSTISKVQPVTDGKMIIHHSSTPVQERSSILEHRHHGHNVTPKVRPSQDYTSLSGSIQSMCSSDNHSGHAWVQKVQPYHESPSLTFELQEPSAPNLAVDEEVETTKKDEEPSKTASY